MADPKYYVQSMEINAADGKPVPNMGSVNAGFTYGYVAGFNGASSLKGDYSDWLAGKGPTEGILATAPVKGFPTLTDAVNLLSAPAWSSADPVWLAVPIARSGFRTFGVHLTGGLNQDLNVSAWLVPEIADVNGFAGTNLATAGGLFATPVITGELLVKSNAATLAFGPNGKDFSVGSMSPAGYLLIKFAKTTTPTSGNIRVGIARQK